MKRPLRHILFWLCYWAFMALTELVYIKVEAKNLDSDDVVRNAIAVCFIAMIPQMLFAYYVVYIGLDRIIQKKVKLWRSILEILLVFALCVIVSRISAQFLIAKWIYRVPKPASFLDVVKYLNIIIYMLVSTGLVTLFKTVRIQLAAKERETNLVREKLSTELKLLRNQLNPHFLFNTLNNIYALTRRKSDKAPEAVMKLSELLSFMLYESGKDTVPISKEIQVLDDYIELESIRYADHLSIRFNKEIDNYQEPIAPLILLPIVENAFKHGASESRFDSFVTISIILKEGHLDFRVENSFEDDKEPKSKGKIGLISTRRQLELMYSEKQLEVFGEGNKFIVHIKLNLHSYGKV
jgi:two-component system, LytTR family, sensor kinase